MRKKAAEELKKEQERKAAERRRIIEERCGKPKNLEDANEGIYARFPYHARLLNLISIYYLYTKIYLLPQLCIFSWDLYFLFIIDFDDLIHQILSR